MQRTSLMLAALVLASCSANTTPPAGNATANNVTAGNAQSQPAPTFTVPVARVSNEGHETRFSHVTALWDARAGELLLAMTRFALDQNAVNALRDRGSLSETEPHALLLFGFEPGLSEFSAAAVQGHNFMLFHLTDPQPASYSNIGPESIKAITGKAAKGEKIRIQVEFRADKHKFGGDKKVHIDLSQEVVLQ